MVYIFTKVRTAKYIYQIDILNDFIDVVDGIKNKKKGAGLAPFSFILSLFSLFCYIP